MILEFTNGREMELPDNMPDESARQLKMFIEALEERTLAAEAETRSMRESIDALSRKSEETLALVTGNADKTETRLRAETAELRLRIDKAVQIPRNADTTGAVRELQAAIESKLEGVREAVLADRQVIPDEYGEMTRSKAVSRKES